MSDLKRLNVEQVNMLQNLVQKYTPVLSEWELGFITTILHFKKMSPKQMSIVRNIISSL